MHLVQQHAALSGVLLTSAGHEDHVALHVARGLVVLAVADLPAEVRDEQSGVQEPADGVIERLAGREGLMAALVCNHPQTGAEQALGKGVPGP